MQFHHFSGLLVSLTDSFLSHADTADTDSKITKVLLAVPVADGRNFCQPLLHGRGPAVPGKIQKTTENPCTKIDHFCKFAFCSKELFRPFQKPVAEMMGILFHFQRGPLPFPLRPSFHKHTDHSAVKIFPGDPGFHTFFFTCLVFQHPGDQAVEKIIFQGMASQMDQFSCLRLFLAFFPAVFDQPG